MTGISTVKSRRLPASLSRRLINSCQWSVVSGQLLIAEVLSGTDNWPLTTDNYLVVARNRFDRRDDLVVGDFVGGAREGGVAPVGQDGDVAFGIAAQSADELAAFGVVEGSKVHVLLLPKRTLSYLYRQRRADARAKSRMSTRN